MFTVIVTELETGLVVSNLSSLTSPSFSLSGLKPEQEFSLGVYASNLKGRSKEVLLHVATPKIEAPERPTDQVRC
jgi:hypothetical protein